MDVSSSQLRISVSICARIASCTVRTWGILRSLTGLVGLAGVFDVVVSVAIVVSPFEISFMKLVDQNQA